MTSLLGGIVTDSPRSESGGKLATEVLEEYLSPRFEDLQLPFACTAFNLNRMRNCVFRAGNLPRAVSTTRAKSMRNIDIEGEEIS